MDPEPRGCRGRGRQTQVLVEGRTMFEHSLIDLEKPRRRRWISLPIAVGLHVVGLTTFAFASYWSVGEVPEPQIVDVFFSEKLLPELSGGGGGPKPPDKPPVIEEEQKPPVPDQPVQPTEDTVPDDLPTPADTSIEPVVPGPVASDSLDFGDGPGIGPGIGPGVGPGIGDGPGGPGIGPSGDGDGGDNLPVHITVGMTKPEVIHKVQPRYTELGRRSGTQGSVIVEAIIDENGRVTGVRVLRGLPMGLDKAAVEAIQQWRFTPARLAGKPVKVYFMLTVNFTIQR